MRHACSFPSSPLRACDARPETLPISMRAGGAGRPSRRSKIPAVEAEFEHCPRSLLRRSRSGTAPLLPSSHDARTNRDTPMT
jgi:hypothetical protein